MNPNFGGARLRYSHRWNKKWYGYAEALGGYHFGAKKWGGEASAGVGFNF